MNFRRNDYEIILIENNSPDKSYKIAKSLSQKWPQVKVFKQLVPAYGQAIRFGISQARFNQVIQFDLDFIDLIFLKQSLRLLRNYDIVIGSKLHPKSEDRRSIIRKLVTLTTNLFIRLFFQYPGSDTHGIKAYRKEKILGLLKRVKAGHHFFETELILRSYADGLKIKELPVEVKEIRSTRFPTVIRVFQAFKEILLLIKFRKELVKND